jgi:DNA primase
MSIPDHVLEAIRSRLPVSAVVGQKIRLKRAGSEFRGLSPFNKERSPSFFCNDQKGMWFDHSAGKNGNIFTWLVETEGLTFPEAVERLAAEAGVEVPKASPEERQREERRRGLGEIVELAAAWFERQLQDDRVLAYLESRGIGHALTKAYRLGFAPRSGLLDHLRAKGVDPAEALEAGLLVADEDTGEVREKFRNRLIFPICDVRGRVVGFGGRILPDGKGPKYLNSPETPLFDKGRLLYNLHRARGPAHERGEIIVVEGNVDVIAMEREGWPNTVAPLGTALSESHLTLLWQVVDEPTILMDGDRAGRLAAYRTIDRALPHLAPGKSLRFAMLPEGQDPDDLSRSAGPEAIARVLKASRSLVDLLWQREVEAAPHDTPERRAGLERRLEDACRAIQDRAVASLYRTEMRQRMRDRFAGQRRVRGAEPLRLSPDALAIMSRPIGFAEGQRAREGEATHV